MKLRENDPVIMLILQANAERLKAIKRDAGVDETGSSLERDLQATRSLVEEIKASLQKQEGEQ